MLESRWGCDRDGPAMRQMRLGDGVIDQLKLGPSRAVYVVYRGLCQSPLDNYLKQLCGALRRANMQRHDGDLAQVPQGRY